MQLSWIFINMHKISSIHLFILSKQQILESSDFKGATHTVDHAHPKIISYPKIVSLFKNSVYSIDSFVRYSQFRNPVTRVARTHGRPHSPQYFFYQLLISGIDMWKCRLFYHFVLEMYLIQKSCNRTSPGPRPFWPICLRNKLIYTFTAFTCG